MSENKKTILDQLNEDVVISDKVRQKADAAFDAIRSGKAPGPAHAPTSNSAGSRVNPKKRSRKRLFLLSAAAVLTIGAASVGAAAYKKWSKALSEGLHANEEQQQMLEENGMVSFLDQTQTDQDISVTLQQTIVDNYFAYLVFRVEGYQVAAGDQPAFEHPTVLVDGKDGFYQDEEFTFGMSMMFYDGLVAGPDGRVQRAGSDSENTEEGGMLFPNYIMEDGSMECWLILDGHGNKGLFLDRPIHIELQNLGTVAKAQFFPAIEASWTFDCVLTGSEEVRSIDMNTPVGNTGITVTHAELSPISAYIEYQYSGQDAAETIAGEYPGIMMKDGSMYPYIWYEPGIRGCLPDDSNTQVTNFSFDRILDVEQIEALLFLKPRPEGVTDTRTKDDCYIVPLSS